MKREFLEKFKQDLKQNKIFFKRLHLKFFLKKEILDVGSGLGSLAIDLAKRGARVFAIDINKKYIEFSNSNLKTNYRNYKNKINYRHSSILNLKSNKKFDYIIIKDTLEHLDNLNQIFKKIYKMLKKDGLIYISIGPLYFSPFGGHQTNQKIPWLHFFKKNKLPSFLSLNKLKKDDFIKTIILKLNIFNLTPEKIKF